MHNIANHIRELAGSCGERQAIIIRNGKNFQGSPVFASMTYGELDRRSDYLAWGLSAAGMRPGMKAVFIAKPSLELYALYLAAMKLGAVPVLIPQVLGWSYTLTCVMQCAPAAFIGTPGTFCMKVFFGRAFSTVDVNIMIGKFQLFGGLPSGKLKGKDEAYPIYDFGDLETEALLFTTGSTGDAKGAILTNEMLEGQLGALEELCPKQGNAPDLSFLVPHTLLGLCLGRTMLIENADANPQDIVETVASQAPEYAFASPATWTQLADFCKRHKCRLEGLKNAVLAGHPALTALHTELALSALDENADTIQTYGMAEALFVSAIKGLAMLEAKAESLPANPGRGICLGRPAKGIQCRIISATDGSPLPADEAGEICLCGTGVATDYLNRPDESAMCKIEEDGRVWLRSGDIGFLDRDGLLWYLGRSAFVVETSGGILYPSGCEEIMNTFPGIRRSLLVGIGEKPAQIPVLIIEPEPDSYEKMADSRGEILKYLGKFPQTAGIRHLLFRHEIPDDVPQNTQWAAERI